MIDVSSGVGDDGVAYKFKCTAGRSLINSWEASEPRAAPGSSHSCSGFLL